MEKMNNVDVDFKMLAYKVALNGQTRVLITLEIPRDALTNMNRTNVVNKQTAKYRTNKAKVLNIFDSNGNKYTTAKSGFYDKGILEYRVGELIIEPNFDTNLEEVCSKGIHFFLDKKVAEEYHLIKIQNGLLIAYCDNGVKLSETNFVNGVQHGLLRTYYDSGELYSTCNYVNGYIQGLVQVWYKDGKKFREYTMVDGLVQGICQSWHENGAIQSISTYVDNKFNGSYQDWYPNGQIRYKCNYKNDELDGIAECWHEDGSIGQNITMRLAHNLEE
jgi:antitoxin component YwqK of YwqJK toxin-antitoxin module